jgi:hypothetical protein
MKKYLFAIIVLAIVACEDPTPTDPIVGKWTFESYSLSGNPAIKASFNIVSAGESYNIENLQVSIDGTPSNNHSVVMSGVKQGDKIGKMSFNNGEAIIEFINMDQLGTYPTWFIDEVKMEKGNQIFTYKGQGLKNY